MHQFNTQELDATVAASMDRFVYQNGLSSFMAPRQQQHHPMTMTTVMMAARLGAMSKPKAEKKSHSEAESRRRKRINDHLTTLRSILPSKVKTDKATLLMETVQHVKELQKKFREVGVKMKTQLLPTESDSVSVSPCEDEKHDGHVNSVVVRAALCCEDRPKLNRDLIQLLQVVQGKISRTEMVTVGGRTKLVLTLNLGKGEGEIGRLRRGLLAVAENRLSSHLVGMGSNKKGRFIVSNQVDGGLPASGGGVTNFTLR